jgi:hypothetical protein
MFDTPDAADYAERAEMHMRLAESTRDPAARQMHLAMAAEFRRRARELGAIEIVSSQPGPRIELNVAVG